MKNVTGKGSLQLPVFPLDFLREPNLAVPQFVKTGLDILLDLVDLRELNQRIGLLRTMIGHIQLARTVPQIKRRYLLRSRR